LHITPDLGALELLDANRKRCVQEIVGSLLYYAQVVDNKLLMALSAIAACQANATVTTAVGPFAQARDTAQQEEEEEHADHNLRKVTFKKRKKGLCSSTKMDFMRC
jgi:hypothetical protein